MRRWGEHFILEPFLNLALFIVLILLNLNHVLHLSKLICSSLLFQWYILSLLVVAHSSCFLPIYISTLVKTLSSNDFFFTNPTQIISLLQVSLYDAGAPVNFPYFTVILSIIQSSLPSTEITLSKIPSLTKNKNQNSWVSSIWIFNIFLSQFKYMVITTCFSATD